MAMQQQKMYDDVSELNNMQKLAPQEVIIEKTIEEKIEKIEKIEDVPSVDKSLTYNGYKDWIIIADTLENTTLSPTEHFPEMVDKQLEIDRTKFDVTILNHSITDSNNKFWITLTLGITPIKKQRRF